MRPLNPLLFNLPPRDSCAGLHGPSCTSGVEIHELSDRSRSARFQDHDNIRFHNGLPDGWNRDRFRQLCVCYAQIRGASSQCIRTFEIIIDMIYSKRVSRSVPRTFLLCPSGNAYCRARFDRPDNPQSRTQSGKPLASLNAGLGPMARGASVRSLASSWHPALNLIPEMIDAEERIQGRQERT